jgi:dephospho-CoA kinase
VGPIGQEWDARTYVGIGPHPSDPRAPPAASEIIELVEERRPGTRAEHVGSTAVPDLVGKNFIDLQITADPEDVPSIVDSLLGLGFVRQKGPDPWPPERPMLEGTYRCPGAVFGVHAHVVPTTDPDVEQMAAFRDLLRSDPGARETYAAEKHRILERTDDVRGYTEAKTDVIVRLLAHRGTDPRELG